MGSVGMAYTAEARVDPKAEAEAVMNAGIPVARKLLAEHGEFYPYAMAMAKDGKVVAVAATTAGDHPASQDVIEGLVASLRAGASKGEYKASAVFFDVRVQQPSKKEKTDAVQVSLEHIAGYCVDVFFPYIRHADGSLSFGDIFASKRTGVVFTTCK
jgi:hypothetical protein